MLRSYSLRSCTGLGAYLQFPCRAIGAALAGFI